MFQTQLSGQGNAASRSQHSLPRQPSHPVKHLGYMAGAARISRRFCHRAICTHSASRDVPYDGRDRCCHCRSRVVGSRSCHVHGKITPMTEQVRDPKMRFSDRVDDYIKYRPRYGREVVAALASACGLQPHHVMADVGCGTGFSAEPFLQNGNRVIGIEPNREMREAGKSFLASYNNFEMREGTAEQTGLPDDSVDFVIAGQAFHWFNRQPTRAEFARILHPDGWCALIWHDRSTDATPFLRAYEEFLQRHAVDYNQVVHREVANFEVLREFFAPCEVKLITLPAEQRFDLDGLGGRIRSSSYMPREGPKAEAMLVEVPKLFSSFQHEGEVVLQYETKIFYGHLAP